MDWDVFISHRALDDGLVDVLSRALKSVGVRCYVDHHNLKTIGGWAGLVLLAKSSPAVLVLVTPNSYNNLKNVYNEAIAARDEERTMILVHTPDVPIGAGYLGSQFGAENWQLWDGKSDPTPLARRIGQDLGIVHELVPNPNPDRGGEEPVDRPDVYTVHSKASVVLLSLVRGVPGYGARKTSVAAKFGNPVGGRWKLTPQQFRQFLIIVGRDPGLKG